MNILENLPQESPSAEQEQQMSIIEDKEPLILGFMRPAFFYLRKIARNKESDSTLLSLTYEALVKSARNFKPGMQRFIPYSKAYLRGTLFAYWKDSRVKSADGFSTGRLPTKNYDKHDPRPDLIYADSIKCSGLNYVLMPSNPEGHLGSDEPEIDKIHFKLFWEDMAPRISEVLTAREIQIITLFYIQGLPFPEIQAKLGITRQAIHAAVKRALKKLRPLASSLQD